MNRKKKKTMIVRLLSRLTSADIVLKHLSFLLIKRECECTSLRQSENLSKVMYPLYVDVVNFGVKREQRVQRLDARYGSVNGNIEYGAEKVDQLK